MVYLYQRQATRVGGVEKIDCPKIPVGAPFVRDSRACQPGG